MVVQDREKRAMSRVGLVVSELPVRAEMASFLDAELIATLDCDKVVFADVDGPGAALLRAEGLEVHISPKRRVDLPGGQSVTADHAQASALLVEHRRNPFSQILYGADRPIDFAWYESELASIPRGAVLGGGALAEAPLMLDLPGLVARHGRQIWADASSMAAADFLVTPIAASQMGLADTDSACFRFAVSERERDGPMPSEAPSLAVVVALHADAARLGQILANARAAIGAVSHTTVVCIVRDRSLGVESVSRLVLGAASEDQRLSTVIAHPGADGVAVGFLQTADVIVAATAQDAWLPAVADLRGQVPIVELEPSDIVDRVWQPDSAPARASDDAMLIEFDGEWSSTSERLLSLWADSDHSFFVLHTQEGAKAARSLLPLRLDGCDMVVFGMPGPVTGHARPDRVFAGAIGFRRSVIPSLLRRGERVDSLWELIVWTSGVSLAERVRRVVIPERFGGSGRDLPVLDVAGMPVWVDGRGPLARPLVANVQPGQTSTVPAVPATPQADMRAWVRSHRWADRARLALPWKFGLLARAMKDRWS